MKSIETAGNLPLAMSGANFPIQELSADELDRVAGGSITWTCETVEQDRVCKASDCD